MASSYISAAAPKDTRPSLETKSKEGIGLFKHTKLHLTRHTYTPLDQTVREKYDSAAGSRSAFRHSRPLAEAEAEAAEALVTTLTSQGLQSR